MPQVQPETKLQTDIRLHLQQRYGTKLVLLRNHSGAVSGLSFGLGPGSPDLVGWITVGEIAVFVGIEIKTGTGRVRPNQQAWLDRLLSAGGIAFVARDCEGASVMMDAHITRILNGTQSQQP